MSDSASHSRMSLSLDAVIVTVAENAPKVLVVDDAARDAPVLPSGPLDPTADDKLGLALRRHISGQTGLDVAYVEQLYTFGDRQRSDAESRELSIAYVALVPSEHPAEGSRWIDTYTLFPWEDHRSGVPTILSNDLIPRLAEWATDEQERLARAHITFGIGAPWDPIRVLERYELLYEAGLIDEAHEDWGTDATPHRYGQPLGGDHRRIAATALGRIRGKLTYRPVVFEVLPDEFTLTELQTAIEALVGIAVHKQNFRRQVEQGELVEATGDYSSTGGRPAALYRFRSDVVSERARPGFPLPKPR